MENFEALSTALQATGFAGAIGLIVWLVKRTFSHTIPRLAADFKESLARQEVCFREELRAEREFFQGEMKAQRDAFREESRLQRAEFREGLDRLADRLDALTRKITTSE